MVSAIDGEIVLYLPELSTIEVGTYLVAHVDIINAQRIFIAKSIENDYLENEEILTAECNLQILNEIRNSIPVFRDRRSELYKIKE